MISSRDIFWSWLREGWRYRLAQGATRLKTHQGLYLPQMKHEAKTLEELDYVDYFLLVSDLVRFAKDQGIPVGPGRGSSAASVVCWLLRITEVDPLLYPLMDFTRFIVPGREDLPDIDIDFDDERRHEVREYAVRKYGVERVGNVGTFTKYKGKNGLNDVARVFSAPKWAAEEIGGMVIERSGGDSRADAALADTIEMFPRAKQIMEQFPDLWKACELEGNYRSMSTHAAGLIITNTPISDICALYTRENAKGEKLTAVSVNKYDAEYLGLMKVDLLGLSTMGMISLVLKLANLTLEDLYRIPTDDPKTLAAFKRNDVIGIFQMEGRATRLVGREVKPDNFLDVVDVCALSRPGPLFSGTTAEYIAVKDKKMRQPKIHPILDKITEGTRGQIIYQEQILKALAQFGGLPVKRVHEIRRIISLKLGEAQFNTSAENFADNAVALHGVTREVAMEVWGRVVTSASYAFVYAHSVSYALISWWAMYLKVHYPAEFYASQLRKIDKEKWPLLIKDAEKHGVPVRGVTPGASRHTWSVQTFEAKRGVEVPSVVAGWVQLKGVGEVVASKIEAYDARARTLGEPGITCAEDLLKVSGIGPKTFEGFKDQIITDDPFGLKRVGRILTTVRDEIETRNLRVRRPTHSSEDILEMKDSRKKIVWIGMVLAIEYKDYLEDARARTGKSIEEIRAETKSPDLVHSASLRCYDDQDEDVYLRINRFQFPEFKEHIARIRLNHDVVHVLATKNDRGFGVSLRVDKMLVIDPEEE